MPKLSATDLHRRQLQDLLKEEEGTDHLRVRARGDLLTIESGAQGAVIPHARMRRVGQQRWRLEMATHTGRWETTPFLDSLDNLVEMLVTMFPWAIASFEYPERNSESGH